MAKGIITAKYLEDLGIDKETAEKILSDRGKEIEAEKAVREKLESELKEVQANLETMNSDFDSLKTQNADGLAWKTRFEALQAETEAKAKQAEAERIMQEKEAKHREAFNNALSEIGKKPEDWNNRFIADGYYNEFVKAIDSEENASKSHKDVLHDLVKDDQTAFKGITAVKLAGGTPTGNGKYHSREEIMSIKDAATRQNEMIQNPQFFPELNI